MPDAESELSGPAARAVAVGHAQFAETGYAIERFSVEVVTHPDSFEVVFAPEQTPGHPVRGGFTDAGRELHYWVSRQDFSLLRTSYAR